MRRLLIGCLLALILLASVGCEPGATPGPTPTPRPTSTPRPTPTPTPPVEAWKEYYDLWEDHAERWDDANAIANSTARIALSAPVSELQKLRREWKDVKPPEDLEQFHNKILDYEESIIEGYLAFMSDKTDAVVNAHFKRASDYLDEAFELLPEGFFEAVGE